MNQLSSMVRKLTDELNEIVENIEYEKDEDDITMLFRASVILEDIKKLIKGHPVVRYDFEIKKPYILYPDGRRKET